MDVPQIIIIVMAFFAVLGGLDKIFGNKFGIGQEFENGIMAMGALAVSMIGMICLAPVLADWLSPVIVPVYRFLGADPAMFAGTILACDMGGGPLAKELTADPQAAGLGGVICGSMLGATIVFSIPVALGMLEKEDIPFLAKGTLCGMVTVPIGIFVSGLIAGYPITMVLRNLTPIVIMSVVIALGLWKAEKIIIKIFGIFGKFVVIVITLGLMVAILQKQTGWEILPKLGDISEGYEVIGSIAIVLAGAFPMMLVITKLLKKPLGKFGKLLGINETATAGLIATLANNLATFSMVKDMDNRGKVVNMAFSVSAAFALGDHLGFAGGFAPDLLVPMIVGKLVAGVTAVIIALLLTRNKKEKQTTAA